MPEISRASRTLTYSCRSNILTAGFDLEGDKFACEASYLPDTSAVSWPLRLRSSKQTHQHPRDVRSALDRARIWPSLAASALGCACAAVSQRQTR